MKKENPEVPSAPINYLFFGFYFVLIAAIHVFHTFLIEPNLSLSTYFFATYAFAQCALETLVMVLFAGIVNTYLPRFMNFYIVVVFFMFLSHVIDFPLVRLMDMSFWYALNFISQESYENFIELLLASNVSLMVWVLAGLAGGLLLLSGIFLYRTAEKWTGRRPLIVSFSMLGAALSTLCLFLLSWDYGIKTHISTIYFDRFQKTLPWKSTFFPPRIDYLALKNMLQDPEGEEESMRKLDSRVFSLTHKPDVYLFIVESLREDYITEENAPRLHQFKKQNVSFEMALSNANATHVSWFSLFYSKFPYYWGKVDPDEWKGGSIPLRLLKKMGYKIHVSSSARLTYYQMNRLIFGEGEHLADAMFIPDEEECYEPYLRDESAMENLFVQMQKEGSGRMFIVFLDATHLDYSWPKEMTRFTPYEEKINYFHAALTKDGLGGIINRYRNALSFVDSQFGEFLDVLQQSPGGKEAVVIITGDHGEEFYEHGNLFHASSLSHPQINPPLYYKFGENESVKQRARCKMTCHMDIFPTLFHYLTGEDLMGEVLQGQSIFKENRWPYTVIGRFNASRTPYEYCIHNGSDKLIAEFSDERDIFNSRGLRILSTKNCRDENIVKELGTIHEEFGPALERIFSQKMQ
ncbi:MAG: sulfatase-like hydrolase/transferase [Verrucomicrobia bacterium]|nr:sulfatase-like hydrolase/transferase [Verrucomicrobiota bacterium]